MVRMHLKFSNIAIAGAALLAAFGFIPAANVEAQSLKEMRAQDAEENALQREADFTARVCGGSISASIDWASADDWPEDVSIARACDGALSALEAMCRQGKGRGEISSFVCTGDGDGAFIDGGELTYGATPGESGFDDAMDVLEDEL